MSLLLRTASTTLTSAGVTLTTTLTACIFYFFLTAATASDTTLWGYDVTPPVPITDSFYYDSIHDRPVITPNHPQYSPPPKRDRTPNTRGTLLELNPPLEAL